MTTTAPPLAWRRSGTGPPVLLLHPAGFGSPIYDEFVGRLDETVSCIVADRRGYGENAACAAADLDQSLDDLVTVLDEADVERVTVVGVSAGATLTLGFARRHPERVASALAHEPLLGPLSPQLHAIVTSRIENLVATDPTNDTAVRAFMSQLIGTTTWNSLRPQWRDAVNRHAAVTRHEIDQFASFAVDADTIAEIAACGVVSSVGARSAPARHSAAERLAELGMAVHTVADAGHLPFLENPAAFASLVTDVAGAAVVRS